MTAQEIFDIVHRHLIEQGGQAMDEDGGCIYRADDGRKCAVGCLIPDKLYRTCMEGDPADVLIDNYPELRLLARHRSLLDDLQCLHDNDGVRVHPERWEAFVNEGMANVAEGHELRFTLRTKGQP